MKHLGLLLALTACPGKAGTEVHRGGTAEDQVPIQVQDTAKPGRRLMVYSVWLEGKGDEHRPELDLFMDCLLTGSNFAEFWGGAVRLEHAGSWVSPPPPVASLRVGAPEAWLDPMLAGLALPPAPADTTAIYVVYADAAQMARQACGVCDSALVRGREAGVVLVRTTPPCWAGQGTVRGLTQFTQHELSCAIERLLGEDHCAADGACEARGDCPDLCDNFTGLYCEGAPEQSYTGCDSSPVRGWVVQKLSHKGVGSEDCPVCAPCDFAVETRERKSPVEDGPR